MVGHVWLGGVGEIVNDLGEDDVGRSDVEAMGRVEEGVFFQWVAALVETGERWEFFDTGCVGHEEIARSERSESDCYHRRGSYMAETWQAQPCGHRHVA